MQLHTMDFSGRSSNNVVERETDLGDDLSHGERTDEDIRDCDSIDGDNHLIIKADRHNHSFRNSINGGGMNFNTSTGTGELTAEQQAEMQIGHHQLPPNHPLNAFIGISGLHSIPSLQQHSDVLEKLKMQVRDMKVGLMDPEYAAHMAAFGANVLPTSMSSAFPMPPSSVAAANFVGGGGAQNLAAQQLANGGVITANGNGSATNGGNAFNSNCNVAGIVGGPPPVPGGGGANNKGGASGGHPFSFTSPTAPSAKEANSASNSSTSSEASNSSQQNNGWSFEEQYKQVRQLYEINDDPKRKEFLDDLFSFMQKRGSPINRLPIMAKSVLDLYELYNLVIARGGLVDVINKKLWQEIIKGLHLPSSITSAAFTLRTQYMKYLYPYECEKKNLSTPAELQAAIDGNRREGRRSSYGQYDATMHSQLPLSQMTRPPLPGGIQQMSPLALVTHANNQQAQAAAAAAAAHHMMGPTFGQMPSLVTQEIENRMMKYLQLIQDKKVQSVINASGLDAAGHHHQQQQQQQQHLQQQQQQQQQQHQQQQQQQQRQRSPSPEMNPHDALSALKMSHVALWRMYHNNASPPNSVNTSPAGGNANAEQQQRIEALNLSDTSPTITNVKREREPTPEPTTDDFQPPTKQRVGNPLMPTAAAAAFSANFYLNPHNMAAAAAAASFHQQQQQQQQQAAASGRQHQRHDMGGSDGEPDDDMHDDDDMGDIEHDADGVANGDEEEHNTTGHSSNPPDDCDQRHLNGERVHNQQTHHSHHHLDKSDDSAIENSPSTSSGNRHSSPISTKKLPHNKKVNTANKPAMSGATGGGGIGGSGGSGVGGNKLSALDTLSMLTGLQFQVARNATGANGEHELIVNLELNGIKYSGVLIANAKSVSSTHTHSTHSTHNTHSTHKHTQLVCSDENESATPHVRANDDEIGGEGDDEEEDCTEHDDDMEDEVVPQQQQQQQHKAASSEEVAQLNESSSSSSSSSVAAAGNHSDTEMANNEPNVNPNASSMHEAVAAAAAVGVANSLLMLEKDVGQMLNGGGVGVGVSVDLNTSSSSNNGAMVKDAAVLTT